MEGRFWWEVSFARENLSVCFSLLSLLKALLCYYKKLTLELPLLFFSPSRIHFSLMMLFSSSRLRRCQHYGRRNLYINSISTNPSSCRSVSGTTPTKAIVEFLEDQKRTTSLSWPSGGVRLRNGMELYTDKSYASNEDHSNVCRPSRHAMLTYQHDTSIAATLKILRVEKYLPAPDSVVQVITDAASVILWGNKTAKFAKERRLSLHSSRSRWFQPQQPSPQASWTASGMDLRSASFTSYKIRYLRATRAILVTKLRQQPDDSMRRASTVPVWRWWAIL